MANEIIKTQLHPQKPADETDIIYPETSADQVVGLPKTNETAKQTVVANKDGYSLMPYNAPTQVRVGETQTLPEGYQASVQNVGTPEAPVLNFQIPQGKTGAQGQRGLRGEKGANGQTFYILSHDIRNGVGDVTLSIPTSEFEPAPEAVEGEVVRGISQPSGALFSALPDYNNGAFVGTFTVTTLGYAGVAHGGVIDKTLDINANVHIGRGNTDAKLYVRDIRVDKTDLNDQSKIVINSETLFRSKINLVSSIYSENVEGSIIELPYGGIAADRVRVHTRINVPKLEVQRIGRASGINNLTLDAQIDADTHRIFNCKINTNQININIEQLNSDEAFHFVNLFTGEETVINSAGNHMVTFPCIVYLTNQNANYGVNVTVRNTGYTLFAMGKTGFRVTTDSVDIGECSNRPSDPEYGSKREFVILFLSNYNSPIDGQLITFDIARG